ncbi:MAG: hypothetical protein Q7U91_01460 [Sideroxyarcus sp.]|nr:hypothetical protein [Sideroxyarcus sp.]
MKHPNPTVPAKPAIRPVAEKNGAIASEMPGVIPHPTRRVSDNCPISRMASGSERPPTSPKIHEIRERNAAQQTTANRTKTRVPN